ncbi:MAG: DNA polymerase III subunit alpha [Erysipelotrichaceae bacterium]|nr:DNA polymerase III subunit alpha [Erysipelotrichaceae bacterium]
MFGHLQVYSGYSFQESTMLTKDIVLKAQALNQKAIALTDQNNLFGMVEFYKLCQQANIKPIIGMEASIEVDQEIYPFVLLAKDTQGYFNICQISTKIQVEGYYSIEKLAEFKEHLVILTPGQNGLIERLLTKELYNEALRYLEKFRQLFGQSFYINLHNHQIALQEKVNQQLKSLAQILNIKIVVSNQVSYLEKKDALALDLVNASKKSMTFNQKHELLTNQKYLKSTQEMEALFDHELIDETINLIDELNATIPLKIMYLPAYPVPKNGNSHEYLTQLCILGLKKRFSQKKIPKVYIERLKHELDIILKMKYSDYFLIVWDYVKYAKTHKILVGPGRGSAAGSLVSYVLGITNCDPIEYDLLFERFLNEERVSMPDIDIDFQDDRREEVVKYVIEKYGQEHVAGVVTFNTYGPKVAIKDLGKVINIPLPRLERLSSLVPTSYKLKKSAFEMYNTSAQFQTMVDRDNDYRYIMPSVFLIERLPRNISQHAAGVVLSKEKLNQVIPLCLGPSGALMSQYSKDYIEEVGLLKMDFLGLRNLTVIDYILKMIKTNKNIEINLNEIPLNDHEVFKMIAEGDTFGVFQLESEGMKQLLRKMKVSSFNDIVAANALFRPGPMENIPIFLARKHGLEPIESLHPDLDSILAPTYGIMIYQEQIMQVAQKLAGFSLSKADILRKAVSKKGSDLMLSLKDEFMSGAINNGYSKELATKVFDLIEKFANYGFNKSHSVAYAYIAYQMAYLKVHYPLEFFAALITSEAGSTSSKLSLIQEGRKYGVALLPPSINRSTDRFEVEDGNIRYSLTAIKNVGEAAYRELEEIRKHGSFKNIFDFFVRIYKHKISSKVVESLIDAGALDEFDYPRKMMKENIALLENYAYTYTIGIQDEPILKYEEDQYLERLENEKNVLGIYLTKHPLALYKEQLNYQTIDIMDYQKHIGQSVVSVLSIVRVKVINDKNGQQMCFVTFNDENDQIDGVVFSQNYDKYRHILTKGAICLVEGKITFKTNLSLTVYQVKRLK